MGIPAIVPALSIDTLYNRSIILLLLLNLPNCQYQIFNTPENDVSRGRATCYIHGRQSSTGGPHYQFRYPAFHSRTEFRYFFGPLLDPLVKEIMYFRNALNQNEGLVESRAQVSSLAHRLDQLEIISV